VGTRRADLTREATMKKTLLVAVALLAVGCADPGGWGKPVKLAPASDFNWVPESPQVEALGPGQAIAVWREPLDELRSRFRVRFSTSGPDGEWRAAETITETARYSSSRLAVNATGEAVLGVWDWPGLSVWRSVRGQRWSESRRWFAGISHLGGAVAIGEDGTAAVLWIDLTSGQKMLYASRFSPMSGWGSDDAISSPRPSTPFMDLGKSAVTVDAHGNALATWTETDDGAYGSYSVWTSRAEKESPWRGARRIEESVDFPDAALAGNGEGEAILVWRRGDLYATLFRDGIWGVPEPIAPRERYAFRSLGAIGESGHTMVAWLDFEDPNGPNAVEAVRFDPLRGWGARDSLPVVHPQGSSRASEPPADVVVDRDGNATVVWNAAEGLIAYRYDVGRGWGRPHLIGPSYDLSEVQLDVDAVGNVVVLWTALDGTWVNRFEAFPRVSRGGPAPF
jgi:hypothetical protein